MKTTFKVTELTHDELVNIFSDALYGNDVMDVDIPSQYKHLANEGEGDCYEDKLANVLLNGGELDVYDLNDESEDESEVEWYGKRGENWNSHRYAKRTITSFFYGEQTIHIPCYRISLKTLLNGMSNEKGSNYLHTMFVDEDGDMWTAYNLLQVAVFGEEIYG